MQRFEGKTVLVTGGNSGITAAAKAFAAEGARVIITGCDAQTLEAARQTLGADALAIRNEAGSVASARALADAIASAGRGSTPCSSTRASRSSRRSPIATRPCGISCSTPT